MIGSLLVYYQHTSQQDFNNGWVWGECCDIFWEEFMQICLSAIMRHQFSALVTEEIFVWAFGHFFLFTISWWTVFVIPLAKRTWGSCSQCRPTKYHISKNQSSLGFTSILAAVICNLQGSQLIYIYFFPPSCINL